MILVPGCAAGIGDAAIVEGNLGSANTAKITITLSAPASTAVSVQVTVADGTATAATGDYRAVKTKTITFKPGQRQKVVGVKIYPNTAAEPDETFTVNLSNPSSGLTIDRASGTITILNDDSPSLVP